MNPKNIVCQLTSTAIVAIALTVVWAFIVSWGSRLTGDLFGYGVRWNQESLIITDKGIPVIVTSIGGNSTHRVFRTLDGTEVELEDPQALYSGYLPVDASAPGLLDYPLAWRKRLARTSDLANPPIIWHFVRNSQRLGHAYFVGFDSISKRIAGFIGRQGFRSSLPPEEEWFDVGHSLFGGTLSIYASELAMEHAGVYTWNRATASNRLSPVGFLINGDHLLRIDLRQRTVSVFNNAVGATALAFGTEPIAPVTISDTTNEVAHAGPDRDADDEYRRTTITRFFVRYPDRVVVWDLKNDTSQEFPLPVSLHGTSIQAYSIGNGQLLVQHDDGHWEQGQRIRLRWVDQAGSEVRQELVKIARWRPPSERQLARKDAWAAPLPAYWIYRVLVRRPLELIRLRAAPTYRTALARTWRTSWGAFATLIMLGAFSTAIAWRSHHRYTRPNLIWWTVFVLLFGVPGLIAYRLFHGLPAMEPCPDCGETVPRDRDACARCRKPFRTPSVLGTEIFA